MVSASENISKTHSDKIEYIDEDALELEEMDIEAAAAAVASEGDEIEMS